MKNNKEQLREIKSIVVAEINQRITGDSIELIWKAGEMANVAWYKVVTADKVLEYNGKYVIEIEYEK